MISRLMLLVLLSAGFLPAQFNLFLVENGTEVAIPNQPYSFGTKAVGGAVTVEFHLRNTGTDAVLTDLQLTSPDFVFIPSPPSMPQTVPAGTAVDLMVQFSPSQPGPATANLIANGAQLATFNGTGLASVAVSLQGGSPIPTPIDFGSVEREERGLPDCRDQWNGQQCGGKCRHDERAVPGKARGAVSAGRRSTGIA